MNNVTSMKNIIFIFDMDGVVINTIQILYEIYIDFLSEFGIKGTKEEFNLLNGPKIEEIVPYLKKKYGLEMDEKELLKKYYHKLSFIYDDVKLCDGVENILKTLKSEGFKIALASSSGKKHIHHIFEKFDLGKYFDFFVSGDDVIKAKPSPEIYNLVKKRYPGCKYYVIEDSENGMNAAINAGMDVIFYNPEKVGNCTVENVGGVNYEINSFSEINNLLMEIELNCFTIASVKDIKLKIVDHDLQINLEQKQIIEDLWAGKNLYNGNIVSYKFHQYCGETLIIECFVTQYKYFFAQLKKPELNLNINPIGVSGIIIDRSGNTLVASRNNVTEYKDHYEFVPSGSIDANKVMGDLVLFQEQAIQEFEEEAKLKKEDIKFIEPFCIVFDKNHGVYDICCKIHVGGLIGDLLSSRYDSEHNDEYNQINIVSLQEIRNNIHKCNPQYKYVPTSRIMLNNL